jgi:hypothetical protein
LQGAPPEMRTTMRVCVHLCLYVSHLAEQQQTMPCPPTRAQLQAALELISPKDPRAAALHLATPVRVIATIAVRSTSVGSQWRDSVAWAQPGIAGAAAEACELVAGGHTPDDRYLDLTCLDPVMWTKARVSGTRRILFGTGSLLNAPILMSSPEVGDEQLRHVLRWWLHARVTDPGQKAAVLNAYGQDLLVWVERGRIRVDLA